MKFLVGKSEIVMEDYGAWFAEKRKIARELPAGDTLNRIIARFYWQAQGYAVEQRNFGEGNVWCAVDKAGPLINKVMMAGFGNRGSVEMYLDNQFLQNYSDDTDLALEIFVGFSGLKISNFRGCWIVSKCKADEAKGDTLALAVCRYYLSYHIEA